MRILYNHGRGKKIKALYRWSAYNAEAEKRTREGVGGEGLAGATRHSVVIKSCETTLNLMIDEGKKNGAVAKST